MKVQEKSQKVSNRLDQDLDLEEVKYLLGQINDRDSASVQLSSTLENIWEQNKRLNEEMQQTISYSQVLSQKAEGLMLWSVGGIAIGAALLGLNLLYAVHLAGGLEKANQFAGTITEVVKASVEGKLTPPGCQTVTERDWKGFPSKTTTTCPQEGQ